MDGNENSFRAENVSGEDRLMLIFGLGREWQEKSDSQENGCARH